MMTNELYRADLQRVKDSLGLPPIDDLIITAHINGLSITELAQRLRVTPSTISVKLKKLIERIKVALDVSV